MSTKRRDEVPASADSEQALGEGEYIVDHILAERHTDTGRQYLIRWYGYKEEESTWEPVQNITSGAEHILSRWADDTARISNGYQDPFDVDDFEIRKFRFDNPDLTVPIKENPSTSPKKASSKGSPTQKACSRAARKQGANRVFVDSDDDAVEGELGASSWKRKATPDAITASALQSSTHEAKKQRVHHPNACNKCFQDGSSCDGERPCCSSTIQDIKQCKNMAAVDREEAERMFARPKVSKRSATTASLVDSPAVQERPSTTIPMKPASPPINIVPLKTTMIPKTAVTPKTSELSPMTTLRSKNPLPTLNTQPKTAPPASTLSKGLCELGRESMEGAAIPSRATFSTLSKTTRSSTAPTIFTDVEPKPRTRKPAEGKIYAPSHVQNIIKRGRDGAAPDPNTLVLHDPKDIAVRKTGLLDITATIPTSKVIPTRSATAAERRLVLPKAVSPTAQSIPIICFYFYSGKTCPEGEYECRFLHRQERGMGVAVERLHEEAREYKADPTRWPKFDSPAIVCAYECKVSDTYQSRGSDRCFRLIQECLFAHWKPLKGEWKYHNKVKKTCSFWLNGRCYKSAAECEYSHEELDDVAGRKAKTCAFWYDSYCGRGPPCVKRDACKFSHEITPYIAHNPRTKAETRPMDPAVLQAARKSDGHGPQHEPLHVGLPPSIHGFAKAPRCSASGWMSEYDTNREDQVEATSASELVKNTLGVDFDDLFKWPNKPHEVKKDIYLLIDEDREAEVKALVRILERAGAKTRTPEKGGAWGDFKQQGEGVVILDDRRIHYRDIPYLGHMLLCRYNFFELDTSSSPFSLRHLFMTGQTLFITDQALQDNPGAIIDVVRHVKERNKDKLPGTESRRIFVRPGVTEWLYELATNGPAVNEAESTLRGTLWDEFNSLVPVDSPRDAHGFTDRVLYEPFWLTGHEKDFKIDPESATASLLRAFDSTFCQNRDVSRNWIVLQTNMRVVNEQSKKQEKMYQNLKFMTVNDYKSKIMTR